MMTNAEAYEEAQMPKRNQRLSAETIIGYGAPNQGTNKVHGAPFRPDGTFLTKSKLRMGI